MPLVTVLVGLMVPTTFLIVSLSLSQAKAYEGNSLTNVVWKTLSFYFNDGNLTNNSLSTFVQQLPVPRQYRYPKGVFVTLTKDGKTRACWGSVFPQHMDTVKATAYATIDALTKEYRYRPITKNELPKLKAHVTVIQSLEPIQGITEQNPLIDGLMVRSGGRSGILLPGEATDSHYQLVSCKLKAGIQSQEPCQLYRIRASVYE